MHLALPLWFEIGSFAVLLVILAFDLFVAYRRPHVPKPAESAAWIGFYVGLALLFALAVLLVGGAEHAGQFVAGWLTEYSLSIDNLFVFVIIMTRFRVPAPLQQRTLMIGIVLALVFRGVFIVLGAALIENFSWIFYLFGAFLLYTAVRQALEDEEQEAEEGGGENALTRFLQRRMRLPASALVLVALGTTDVLFALDSIPAIFGITTSPFLVFATNVFALMGLRQLYFLLGHLLEKLEYLRFGIAVVLGFIGVKLVLHALHTNELPFVNGGHGVEWAPEIPTWVSLVVILAAMGLATLASLVKLRVESRR